MPDGNLHNGDLSPAAMPAGADHRASDPHPRRLHADHGARAGLERLGGARAHSKVDWPTLIIISRWRQRQQACGALATVAEGARLPQVLDAGSVAEYDSPENLMQVPPPLPAHSLFISLTHTPLPYYNLTNPRALQPGRGLDLPQLGGGVRAEPRRGGVVYYGVVHTW
jgi:hypothetical protein